VTTVQHLEATPAHAACLSAIHAASVRPGEPVWEAMAFETLIARTGARALLAADGGDPAGFVLWRTAADEAEILLIAVLPDRRRQGIGRGLLERAAASARAAGAATLWLEVAADNGPAITLYRRLGFRDAGRRRAYYHRTDGTRADALVLRLALAADAEVIAE
jgi:ribosomal-protein-alanine N-acetyltransferase